MKRLLTKDEIENILDFIKPNKNIPVESAIASSNLIKERFRKQLRNQEIYPSVIPSLKKEIEKNYRNSLIQPGESVGIIAAQSIGEKNTQSTLNSIDWTEKIIYSKNKEIVVEPIGRMIDNLLLNFVDNIEKIEENRTEYLKLTNDDYSIPSCDEYGNTSWYKIEAITKHLPVGKLVKVLTESGRTVMATQSKSFLVWNEDEKKFIATEGSKVKVGDILPTTKYLNRLNLKTQDFFEYKEKKIALDEKLGFLIGLYLSFDYDKNFLYKKCDELKKIYDIDFEELLDDITMSGIIIPYFSYNSSDEYIKALLSGFLSDCGVLKARTISYYEDIINGISFLLSYYGTFAYFRKEQDELVYKIELVYDTKVNIKNNVYFDKVISIEYVNGTTDYVYDLTVEKTRNFQLFNGLNVRDTLNDRVSNTKSIASLV